MIEVKGFVIVPPLNKWDEKYKDLIWGDAGHPTFGRSPHAAWRRFMGPNHNVKNATEDAAEFSRKVQFFFDRGYRIKDARMIIDADA
jgi:hypothetical protein